MKFNMFKIFWLESLSNLVNSKLKHYVDKLNDYFDKLGWFIYLFNQQGGHHLKQGGRYVSRADVT